MNFCDQMKVQPKSSIISLMGIILDWAYLIEWNNKVLRLVFVKLRAVLCKLAHWLFVPLFHHFFVLLGILSLWRCDWPQFVWSIWVRVRIRKSIIISLWLRQRAFRWWCLALASSWWFWAWRFVTGRDVLRIGRENRGDIRRFLLQRFHVVVAMLLVNPITL